MSGLRRTVESVFETFLFNSRLIVILAVLGSLLSSVLMFVRGAMLIVYATIDFVKTMRHSHGHEGGEELSITLISSVDSFLFATVLLIFAMGIYELFISEIDPASRTADSRPNWLQIHSLDDLKGAVGKVILMILIVRLFESAVKMKYEKPLDLLYLGLGVVFVAVALYLQHLGHAKHGPADHAGHAGHAGHADHADPADAPASPAHAFAQATAPHVQPPMPVPMPTQPAQHHAPQHHAPQLQPQAQQPSAYPYPPPGAGYGPPGGGGGGGWPPPNR